jgi:signal peptidase I
MTDPDEQVTGRPADPDVAADRPSAEAPPAAEPRQVDPDEEDPRDVARPRRYRHAVEVLATVALALSMAFAVEALAVKPYRIPSLSMEPTLVKGQRVLVNRLEKRFGSFGVGDIVVFNPPAGSESYVSSCAVHKADGAACPEAIHRKSSTTFIKRIVAGPGDRLRIVDGHVIRNGKRASEPFTLACGTEPDCQRPTEITIPKDHYFVMGDNRGNSFDSRYWGAIPESWIIGQAFVTYWPPSKLGTL